MKFICDDMLGKLARWLKVLGFDTYYEKDLPDNKLLKIALLEDRIILTRDSKIPKIRNAKNFVWIHSSDPLEQVKEVAQKLKLKIEPERFFTRCLECNGALEKIDKEKVKDKVWPYVYKTQENFVICLECKKVYWAGTHVGRMKKRLEKIVGKKT